MSQIITITSDPTKAIKGLSNLKGTLVRGILNIALRHFRAGAQKFKRKHFRGPTSPTSVRSLSGRLLNSVVVIEPRFENNKITGGISVGQEAVPYTKVHVNSPRGKITTIKPVKAKALTIPTDFAKTSAGRPRGPAFIGGRPNPIWGVTFVAGGMIFGYKRGTKRKYANPVPLFILKKQVKIPSRVDPKEDFIKVVLPDMMKEIRQLVRTSTKVGSSK